MDTGQPPSPALGYRLFVSADRCTLVRIWTRTDGDTAEVATRETPEHTWGPPVHLSEEQT